LRVDLVGQLAEERVGPRLDDPADLAQLLVVQRGLAAAVGEGRRVAALFAELLPDATDAGPAGAELCGDVGGLPTLLVQRDDLATLASVERLHAVCSFADTGAELT